MLFQYYPLNLVITGYLISSSFTRKNEITKARAAAAEMDFGRWNVSAFTRCKTIDNNSCSQKDCVGGFGKRISGYFPVNGDVLYVWDGSRMFSLFSFFLCATQPSQSFS